MSIPQSSAIVLAGAARFTVISPTLLRLEWQRAGKFFVDAPSFFAVNREAGCLDFELRRGANDAVEIDTGRMRLHWKPNGQCFNGENLTVEIKAGEKWVRWEPGQRPKHNLGGTIVTLDDIATPVKLEDGLISRDGWGFVDDTDGPIKVNGWFTGRTRKNPDWYLFGYGCEYRDALRDLALIGGPIPLPRKYVLGAWYSRYWPYTSEEYRALVKEYETHDFPLDVIVMDMDWHRDGWTGWSWNRELLPDAEKLLADFHSQQLAVTLNLHPANGVEPHEDCYAALMRALGKDPASQETILFDSADKRYLDTVYQNVMMPLVNAGADFWWLDWQQEKTSIGCRNLTNLTALNTHYSEATASPTRRGISFSRWAGYGDHRNPIHFSGDAHILWEMLAFEIPFTTTAGNVGCFFWSHDIGGHMFGLGRHDELYTRWVQFGAMSPALRSHSTRDEALDRRPWTYGKPACDSMRKSFHLRSELFPYIYSSVAQSCRETWPLCRPLYLEWPREEQAYQSATEYLFGDHLLVAPICTPGEGPTKIASRPVWFPPESTWFDWFTGERIEGGTERLVAAALDEFPLYARGGAPIPMQPYTPRMGTTAPKELIVRCWPGEDGSTGKTALYEDDGISPEYRKGASAITALLYERKGNEHTLTVFPTEGSYQGQPRQRALRLQLMSVAQPTAVTLGSQAADFEYDAATGTVTIRVPERSICEKTAVTVTARESAADRQRWVAAAQKRRMEGVLGRPVKDAAAELAGTALTAAQRAALQAVLGFGLVQKNDAPYLYGGHDRWYLYAREAIQKAEGRVSLQIGGKEVWSGATQPAEIPAQSPAPIQWPIEIGQRLEFTLPGAGAVQAES